MSNIYEEILNKFKTSEYNKKYYEEHKTKMLDQIKKSKEKLRIKKIIKKLNEKTYKRIPYNKIKKYDIKIDSNGIYYKRIYF